MRFNLFTKFVDDYFINNLKSIAGISEVVYEPLGDDNSFDDEEYDLKEYSIPYDKYRLSYSMDISELEEILLKYNALDMIANNPNTKKVIIAYGGCEIINDEPYLSIGATILSQLNRTAIENNLKVEDEKFNIGGQIMSKYLDSASVYALLYTSGTCDRNTLDKILDMQGIEIIHCKECKYSHMTINGECQYCDIWWPDEKEYMDGDHFCAWGEKRDDK